MVEHSDEYLRVVKHKQFLDEVEKSIRIANLKVNNAHTQTMDRNMFLAVDALHRAIERGYVHLADYGPTEDGQPGPWRAFRETRP